MSGLRGFVVPVSEASRLRPEKLRGSDLRGFAVRLHLCLSVCVSARVYACVSTGGRPSLFICVCACATHVRMCPRVAVFYWVCVRLYTGAHEHTHTRPELLELVLKNGAVLRY